MLYLLNGLEKKYREKIEQIQYNYIMFIILCS